MDYTQNLHLPQWEASDRIHHDDFNDAFAKIDTLPRIATGTYTGTGTYGSSNPNTLTFPFAPKLLLVQNENGAYAWLTTQGSTGGFTSNNSNNSSISATWSGTSVSWYASSSYATATLQLNASGAIYQYMAIG